MKAGGKVSGKAQAAKISEELRALSNTETTSPVIVTSQPFYGVPVPKLKELAKEWTKTNRNIAANNLLEIFELLWQTGIREELLVASFLLGAHKDVIKSLPGESFIRWSKLLDNWETTDQLSAHVFSPWLQLDPRANLKVCKELITLANPWAKRLGVVGPIKLARTTEITDYWPEISKLLLAVKEEKEGVMPKAISWVMRESIKGNRALVEEFLETYREQLPAVAVRETSKKLLA